MDNPRAKRCTYAVRIENLAATDSKDLSSDEREELHSHLATCQECAELYATLRDEYQQMDALILSFPADESLPHLTMPSLKQRRITYATPSTEGELLRPFTTAQQTNEVDDYHIYVSDIDTDGPPMSFRRRLGTNARWILVTAAIVFIALIGSLLFSNYSNSNTQGSPIIQLIPSPSSTTIPHDQTVLENLQFRCAVCGQPQVVVTMTKIVVQGDLGHIVVYFRVTNKTIEGIGIVFTTIQIRKPDGSIVRAIASNDPALFVEAKASETTTIAFDFTPEPNVPYKLDLALGKAGAWDNLYQSTVITFSSRR